MDREEERERELGRKKLMLRMPAFRGQLRHASRERMEALFVAYGRAAAHQDRIRSQKHAPARWTAYYEEVSGEIEESVVRFLTTPKMARLQLDPRNGAPLRTLTDRLRDGSSQSHPQHSGQRWGASSEVLPTEAFNEGDRYAETEV